MTSPEQPPSDLRDAIRNFRADVDRLVSSYTSLITADYAENDAGHVMIGFSTKAQTMPSAFHGSLWGSCMREIARNADQLSTDYSAWMNSGDISLSLTPGLQAAIRTAIAQTAC